jgi:hypothetical protein
LDHDDLELAETVALLESGVPPTLDLLAQLIKAADVPHDLEGFERQVAEFESVRAEAEAAGLDVSFYVKCVEEDVEHVEEARALLGQPKEAVLAWFLETEPFFDEHPEGLEAEEVLGVVIELSGVGWAIDQVRARLEVGEETVKAFYATKPIVDRRAVEFLPADEPMPEPVAPGDRDKPEYREQHLAWLAWGRRRAHAYRDAQSKAFAELFAPRPLSAANAAPSPASHGRRPSRPRERRASPRATRAGPDGDEPPPPGDGDLRGDRRRADLRAAVVPVPPRWLP